jgi:hypothetical protein
MSTSTAERGSILVEVVFLLVLLTAPVFYLVGTLGRLQAGAYAVSAAGREAGRAYVTSPDQASAGGRALAAANLVHAAHGFETGEAGMLIDCAAPPCLRAGESITVSTTLDVELPLIPDFMAGVVPTSVRLTAQHVEPVDAFRNP